MFVSIESSFHLLKHFWYLNHNSIIIIKALGRSPFNETDIFIKTLASFRCFRDNVLDTQWVLITCSWSGLAALWSHLMIIHPLFLSWHWKLTNIHLCCILTWYFSMLNVMFCLPGRAIFMSYWQHQPHINQSSLKAKLTQTQTFWWAVCLYTFMTRRC